MKFSSRCCRCCCCCQVREEKDEEMSLMGRGGSNGLHALPGSGAWNEELAAELAVAQDTATAATAEVESMTTRIEYLEAEVRTLNTSYKITDTSPINHV